MNEELMEGQIEEEKEEDMNIRVALLAYIDILFSGKLLFT